MTTIYAMERHALENWLSSRERISAELARPATESALLQLVKPPEPSSPEAVDGIYSLDEASGTAAIAVKGALSNEGESVWDRFLGIQATSYRTVRAALEKASEDDRVVNVALNISSPGGAVEGADETWQAIRALNAKKPVAAVGEGMVASAAYWLACGASKIVASSASTLFGSIGVMAAVVDCREAQAKEGFREIRIVSGNAPAKDLLSDDGEGIAALRGELDALERIFYDRIAQGRGTTADCIAENYGRGGMLVARDPSLVHMDALRAGMIDGFSSGAAGAFAPAGHIKASTEAPSGEPEGGVENTAVKEKAMTLHEFLGQNPAAKAEVDALKAEARQAGMDEAKAGYKAKAEKCAVFIAAENYPQSIRVLAAEVLSGKKEMGTLESLVAFVDMEAEKKKSEQAQAESSAAPAPVPPAPGGESAEEKAFRAIGAASIEALKAKRAEAAKWA